MKSHYCVIQTKLTALIFKNIERKDDSKFIKIFKKYLLELLTL